MVAPLKTRGHAPVTSRCALLGVVLEGLDLCVYINRASTVGYCISLTDPSANPVFLKRSRFVTSQHTDHGSSSKLHIILQYTFRYNTHGSQAPISDIFNFRSLHYRIYKWSEESMILLENHITYNIIIDIQIMTQYNDPIYFPHLFSKMIKQVVEK